MRQRQSRRIGLRVVAALGSLALAGCSVVGIRSGTEEPSYTTLAETPAFEVRRYGDRVAADTLVDADPEAARNVGFRRLAGYIFGDNRASEKIAMTAPVEQAGGGEAEAADGEGERIAMTAPVAQAEAEGGWRIRFFLPEGYTAEGAPVPTDPQVTITTVPGETVAVRRFSGSRSAEAVADETNALLDAVADSDWRATGAPVAWFYDPPWTLPPMRRNEVAVPVEAVGSGS
jgi:hypothetical protein